ncbi:MAG: hypothetical protein MI723_13105, partial [Caulobacterales bacterium]|nr:hypothetical protein [Caulobacterales bacterium]
LFASEPFQKLINQWAKSNYETIIIDSAPIIPVADSRELCKHVDDVIYVIKWMSTSTRVIRNGIDHLRTYGVENVAAAINFVDLKKARGYASGDDYYYAHKYGQYYQTSAQES